MAVLFLFNLICAIISCDPVFKSPVPSSEGALLKDFRVQRNLDFENDNSIEWKPPDPIVQTKSGTVEGYIMKVVNGREIYAFEGIPFGEPPVGDNRFRAPLPKRPWSGIRQAKKPGHYCTQVHLNKLNRVLGNEDCLFLNLFSPMIPFEGYHSRLPVLIFFYGGAFTFGSGSEYGPAFLLKKDIVLVTVNYRVGPLGFLSTGDEEASGNWGLKDQALAIKWVSENVEYFGGNASAITLIGQSAGATSVHLHMMSNQSNHLFHRGISVSGSGFNPWSVHTPHQARKYTEKLARFLRCPTSSSAEMIKCFRQRDGNFITINQQNLYDVAFPIGFPPVLFRPVIEPDVPGAFLTISPKEAYEQGKVAKIPYLATNTKDEADYVVLVLKSLGIFRLWMRHWEQLAPAIYDYRLIAGDNSSAVTRALIDYYFKGEVAPNDLWKTSGKEVSKAGTDRHFYVGNRKTLKYHSQIAPTYSYIFGLKNSKGWANMFGLSKSEEYGVSHFDDLGFVFNSSVYWEAFDAKNDADMMQISDFVVNLFSNFITTGEPLYMGEDGKQHRIWEPIKDPDNPIFLKIDKQVEMISDPAKRDIEFWESMKLDESYPYEYA